MSARPSVMGGRAHAESPEWMPASSMCSMTPARNKICAVVDRIDVDLDGIVEKPVDENRVLGAHLGGPADVVAQHVVVVDDFHSTTTEDVRRTDEDREADLVGDLLGLVERGGHAVTWRQRDLPRPAPHRTRPAPRPGESLRARCRRWAHRRPSAAAPARAGVCPPSWTMTPATSPTCCSAATTSRTSSRVRGSK